MTLSVFIIKNIVTMHNGTAILKLKSSLILSVLSMPLAVLTEGLLNWFSVNAVFISFVFGAVIIDHILGSYVHAYIKRDFTLKKNVQGFFIKTGLIVAVWFIGQGIVHILGSDDIVGLYFRTIMRLMVFLYPAGSALVNCSTITNGKFPPIGLMKKISKFNSSLQLSDFKGKEQEDGEKFGETI